MKREEFEYMKEALATDLAELLVINCRMSTIEALDVLYSSDTYARLCDPQTGLYFQSSLYVYSLLENELAKGTIG